MQITYSIAQMQDLDEVFSLVRCAIRRMDEIGIHQWNEIYPCREDLSEDISNGEMRIGRIDGRIAVIYVLNKDYDEEYKTAAWTHPEREWRVLHRLCVHPDFQNRGVARLTLDHMQNELREMGVQALRLDVFSQNPYSRQLYAKAGFTQTGIADWRMGRFYIMEKYLDEGAAL